MNERIAHALESIADSLQKMVQHKDEAIRMQNGLINLFNQGTKASNNKASELDDISLKKVTKE